MELNKNILDGISLACKTSELSDGSYDSLIQQLFKDVTMDNTNESKKSNLEGGTAKSVYSSLLSLLLEAAKHNADPSSVSSVLEDCKWETRRISSFVIKFQENKEVIQTKLAMIGKSFDHIVDICWRQDFVIKTNNCDKKGEPSYIVSLKTRNPQFNTVEDITFSCTLEQLQDLVFKLKDATKCIERNAV